MIKFYVSLVILLPVLNLTHVQSACVLLDDCPAALKHIEQRRDDPQTRKILRSAHCGLVNTGNRISAKVRCENIPDLETPNSGRRNVTLPKPGECGQQVDAPRIHKGQIANLEEYPWLALLQYKNKSNHVSYRCHGILISKRYVLTAAHCLSFTSANQEKVGKLDKIVLGEYDTSTRQDCLPPSYGGYCTDPVQILSAESIHVHPDFGSDGAVSDIGLIRLEKDVTFSEFVRPICLPTTGVVLKPYDSVLIAGWGKTETQRMSNVKLWAAISYLPNRDCFQYNIDSTQICAGSRTGADTCKGDSGGPLMVTRLTEDREPVTTVVGIVSFGGECGSGSAIYTKVSMFVKWILDTIHD